MMEKSPESPATPGTTPVRRILLVEDNEAAIIQVKSVLENEGYLVDVARGGQEAIDYVQRRIPDGIILDLMMPHVDGFEVLEKIRGTEITAEIPVLVLTAKDLTPQDFDKLSANNIQQLIQKGDVDRQGLLFKTQLMLGVKPILGANVSPKPRTPQASPCKPQAFPRNTAISRVRPTILVVEDNPDNMLTIKAVLKHKFTVLEAVDGETGLRKALSMRPDLILLDMALPGMDGLEVVHEIKKNSDVSHIPVIALTAKAMKGDREKILEAGCDDYISKPFDPEDMVRKTSEWLSP
jgi:CheY-like chemotaxis protein